MCSACRRPVWWLLMTSGPMACVDAEPSLDGRIVEVLAGINSKAGRVYRRLPDGQDHPGRRWTEHQCPAAQPAHEQEALI